MICLCVVSCTRWYEDVLVDILLDAVHLWPSIRVQVLNLTTQTATAKVPHRTKDAAQMWSEAYDSKDDSQDDFDS